MLSYKLRLEYYFLNGSQSFRPLASATMQPAATDDAGLSDRTVLPKASTVMFTAGDMALDIYEDTEKCDCASKQGRKVCGVQHIYCSAMSGMLLLVVPLPPMRSKYC